MLIWRKKKQKSLKMFFIDANFFPKQTNSLLIVIKGVPWQARVHVQ